jgi:large conductance mechanosensitive channel
MLKEFREFIMRGNVIDMAVGIVIGVAFGAIVQSLVNDIIMPPIGLLLGSVDFSSLFILLKAGTPPPPYATPADAQAAGAVTINYGLFINAVISFLIIALAVFLLVRAVNRLRQEHAEEAPAPEVTTKTCPYCTSTIAIQATRCPYCTSDLQAAPAVAA